MSWDGEGDDDFEDVQISSGGWWDDDDDDDANDDDDDGDCDAAADDDDEGWLPIVHRRRKSLTFLEFHIIFPMMLLMPMPI